MTRSADFVAEIEPLRRYARVLLRDPEAADDLVQATFLRACERLCSFRDGANPRVWLMSVMHNLFIDQTRSARAALQRDRAWADLTPPHVAARGETAARLAQIARAFATLPEDQREALHLLAVEGLSVAEVAAILSLPPGTVMSRVARARASLRAFEAAPDAAPVADDGTGRALRVIPGGTRNDR